MSTGPTTGRWALALTHMESCTTVACWRSVCRALAALLLFLLAQRRGNFSLPFYVSSSDITAGLRVSAPASLDPARRHSKTLWNCCATRLGCRHYLMLPGMMEAQVGQMRQRRHMKEEGQGEVMYLYPLPSCGLFSSASQSEVP